MTLTDALKETDRSLKSDKQPFSPDASGARYAYPAAAWGPADH